MEIIIDSLSDLDKVADAVLSSLNGRNVVAFLPLWVQERQPLLAQ